MDLCHYISLFSVAGKLAGFVLSLCTRVWVSHPNSHTECKVPGAVWDGSPAVLLAPVLFLIKQNKLQKSPPPPFYAVGIEQERLWGCFLSFCPAAGQRCWSQLSHTPGKQPEGVLLV